jgi:hypothetical protein
MLSLGSLYPIFWDIMLFSLCYFGRTFKVSIFLLLKVTKY